MDDSKRRNFFGGVLVVTGMVLVLWRAWSEEYLSAAGLVAVIAGYLIGRTKSHAAKGFWERYRQAAPTIGVFAIIFGLALAPMSIAGFFFTLHPTTLLWLTLIFAGAILFTKSNIALRIALPILIGNALFWTWWLLALLSELELEWQNFVRDGYIRLW